VLASLYRDATGSALVPEDDLLSGAPSADAALGARSQGLDSPARQGRQGGRPRRRRANGGGHLAPRGGGEKRGDQPLLSDGHAAEGVRAAGAHHSGRRGGDLSELRPDPAQRVLGLRGQPFRPRPGRKGPGKVLDFKSPGLVRVFCNVHHSMVAYIWVLDTPFYTTPDGSGASRSRTCRRGRERSRSGTSRPTGRSRRSRCRTPRR
jgi:hypothetical protein